MDKKEQKQLNEQITKIKKLMKLNEGFDVNLNNIRIVDYDLKDENSLVLFFILPQDENEIETKNGRELHFDEYDFSYFIEKNEDIPEEFYEYEDSDYEFDTRGKGEKHFNFDDYFFGLSENEKVSLLKAFISFKLKNMDELPEII